MPRDSNIDLPASAFTVIGIDRAKGIVRIPRGTMSVDEAAGLLEETVRAFDWDTWTAQVVVDKQSLSQPFETMLDVLSLMNEIDLHRSRSLWVQCAPANAGMPRMLAKEHEAQELRYLGNLAAQRGLDDDELALHILDEGSFMAEWAEARREFVSVP